METPKIAAKQRVRAVAEDYRRQGYDVLEEPSPESLPDFLAGHQPDLIARRANETVVVEVKSRRSLADEPQVRDLARLLQGKEHWSFELVIVPEEKPVAPEGAQPFTREEVLRGLEEVVRLLELGFSEAAMLRTWGTAEAALRIIAEEQGVELERYAPSYILKRVVSDGIISREEYAFFMRAMEYRNALVHGFSTASFDTNLVRKLIVLIKQLIGQATAAQVVIPDVEPTPPAHVYSPRLVHPEQAPDFAKQVIEVSADAEL
jgi:REase_AHJR-like